MTNLEIRNIVENLRRKAGIFKKSGCATTGIVKCFEESADTIEQLAEELKQWKDKQEQGLLIELPVAIGETVYRINEFAVNPLIPMAVISFEIKGDTDHFKKIGCKELGLGGEWTYRFTDIGKTVFLTHSEAEEALAKMGGK